MTKLTKLRLSDLNTILASRAVNRQAAIVTSGGTSLDDFKPDPPLQKVGVFVEAPRRGIGDRHVSSREYLAQRRAEFEAMDDQMLELEVTTLEQNLGNVRAQLKACYLGLPEERDREWQLRAERAASAIKAEHTLAASELRQRDQMRRDAERQRRIEEDDRRIKAIQEKKQAAAEAQDRFLQMSHALKKARENEHRTHEFAQVFVGEARALLDPEIFQLIIEATKERMG